MADSLKLEVSKTGIHKTMPETEKSNSNFNLVDTMLQSIEFEESNDL